MINQLNHSPVIGSGQVSICALLSQQKGPDKRYEMFFEMPSCSSDQQGKCFTQGSQLNFIMLSEWLPKNSELGIKRSGRQRDDTLMQRHKVEDCSPKAGLLFESSPCSITMKDMIKTQNSEPDQLVPALALPLNQLCCVIKVSLLSLWIPLL